MEEKEEKVVEETTPETVETVEENKPQVNEEGDRVVNLSKPIENETKEDNPVDEGVVRVDEDANATEKQEEVQPEEQAQEDTPVLEEITEEEVQGQTEELTEQDEEDVDEAQETGKDLTEKDIINHYLILQQLNERLYSKKFLHNYFFLLGDTLDV